eukprot:SM004775S16665  [mRNA]  locus=s4775:300:1098:- [translate_table: standard]
MRRCPELGLTAACSPPSLSSSTSILVSSQHDLHQLAQAFGAVQKVVLLRAKNQALLQMQELPSAIAMVQFYSEVQPNVRGRNVYMQFSSHQELTSPDPQAPGQPRRPGGDQ